MQVLRFIGLELPLLLLVVDVEPHVQHLQRGQLDQFVDGAGWHAVGHQVQMGQFGEGEQGGLRIPCDLVGCQVQVDQPCKWGEGGHSLVSEVVLGKGQVRYVFEPCQMHHAVVSQVVIPEIQHFEPFYFANPLQSLPLEPIGIQDQLSESSQLPNDDPDSLFPNLVFPQNQRLYIFEGSQQFDVLIGDFFFGEVHLFGLLGHSDVLDCSQSHWPVLQLDLQSFLGGLVLELYLQLKGYVVDSCFQLRVSLGQFFGVEQQGGVLLGLASQFMLQFLVLLAVQLDLFLDEGQKYRLQLTLLADGGELVSQRGHFRRSHRINFLNIQIAALQSLPF